MLHPAPMKDPTMQQVTLTALHAAAAAVVSAAGLPPSVD